MRGGPVRNVRRFFWWPRGAPRRPTEAVPVLRVWLALLALGAGAAALHWDDVGSTVMLLGALFAVLDDVNEGVRHRWPALAAGLAVGWAVDRLAGAGMFDSGSSWGQYGINALWTGAALATFVGVSRLPERR